jgi:DNA-binding transcriptional regulator LsrR (DeoR family)
MTYNDELRLMTRIARLYYERNLNQTEIAELLDLSQATISRLLKQAQHENIIRISVNAPPGTFPELEEELQNKYHLKEVIISDCAREDDDLILKEIGAAAAYYLENTIKPNDVVGISSWSATLLAMVDSMHPLPRPLDSQVIQIQVIQILGGVGNPEAETHANHLTTRLAALLHASAKFLPAPGVVGSPETLRVMLEDPFIHHALDSFDQVTLALVGIGALEPSKLLASSGNIFSEQEVEMLRACDAVGDICLRFFKADGAPVDTPLNDRVISMRLDQLKRVRRTVGIAGGSRKFEAIAGALRGGLINVLITDCFTARRLVEDQRSDQKSFELQGEAYE